MPFSEMSLHSYSPSQRVLLMQPFKMTSVFLPPVVVVFFIFFRRIKHISVNICSQLVQRFKDDYQESNELILNCNKKSLRTHDALMSSKVAWFSQQSRRVSCGTSCVIARIADIALSCRIPCDSCYTFRELSTTHKSVYRYMHNFVLTHIRALSCSTLSHSCCEYRLNMMH